MPTFRFSPDKPRINGDDELDKTPESRNISDLLDTLLLGYDNHLRPDFGGKYRQYTEQKNDCHLC